MKMCVEMLSFFKKKAAKDHFHAFKILPMIITALDALPSFFKKNSEANSSQLFLTALSFFLIWLCYYLPV